jgi:D-lactate dehydrogenase (cytochrome)
LGLEEKPTLFLEFHGSESGLKEQSSVVAEIADQNGGSNFQWATKTEDRQKLWSARSINNNLFHIIIVLLSFPIVLVL